MNALIIVGCVVGYLLIGAALYGLFLRFDRTNAKDCGEPIGIGLWPLVLLVGMGVALGWLARRIGGKP